ncbi:hypothetical protein GOB57_10220 [Sinorhizobium meliloti]|nr:hypothetical protein [Sinorhizobium meliloti]
MPDNSKDQFDLGSDYDFDAISEFESDGKGSKAAETETPEFGEFESSSAESEFASFGGAPEFEDSTANVDFGSPEFEPADDFAANGDFDFGGPPSPQSVELESLSGNPDEEFGDFTGNDGFGGTEGRPSDPYAEDEATPANGFAQRASVDPFADEDQISGEADETEPSAKDNTKPGIKHYAGVAAVVAVVGYIGYSQVLPMFTSTDGGQVIAETTPVIQDGNLPANLPPVPTGVQPEQTTGLPQLPVEEPVAVDGASPSVLPPIDLAGRAPTAVDKPVAVDTPAAADIPVGNAPPVSLDLPPVSTSTTNDTPVKADAPVNVDPLDEMVGGDDRGGLASMKDDAVETAPVKEAAAAGADIAALANRLDEVVKRIETIEQKVASFGASFDANPGIKATPADAKPPVTLPAADDGVVSAPLKPPIIENVVLRGVSRDIAWIATGKGVIEVKVGDSIEDAGVVESFQNYRGRWIAVTDKGIILPR